MRTVRAHCLRVTWRERVGLVNNFRLDAVDNVGALVAHAQVFERKALDEQRGERRVREKESTRNRWKEEKAESPKDVMIMPFRSTPHPPIRHPKKRNNSQQRSL